MNKQFYGIKYPFSKDSEMHTLFDLNETKEDKVKSMLLHIILTPKGQRLRNPNFGTDLIKFIFEPNYEVSWDKIKEEIHTQVSFYIPEIKFENIEIIKNVENDSEIYLMLEYSVEENGEIIKNKTVVKL
jgi:phage baseplate assembly protein W